MLKNQRYDFILNALSENGFLTIEEGMKLTGGSRSTIIRDFQEMEKSGDVLRLRGGIGKKGEEKQDVMNITPEPSYKVKNNILLDEKKRIAAEAKKLIQADDTIFLGDGSTVNELAKLLYDISPLFISTNDLINAVTLAGFNSINLTMLGGTLRKDQFTVFGYFTEQMLSQLHADKCFLGVDAISDGIDIMNYSPQEIQGKKLMLDSCKKRIILADHSKFEKNAFAKVYSLKNIDLLITGKEIKDKYKQILIDNEINFITV